MAKLTSGRVKKTPQSGLSSDRYQFLGLEQAEPNLGDPLIGPSSIGANPIKVGSFYQLASIGEYPGERYWSTQVGIGTTLGIISVYANGELPNNAFGRIHGLNFVGNGVTVETPSVNFIGDVGIATVRFTVTNILNQGAPGQVLYNGPNGLAIGSTDLSYYNRNVGIGTSLPNSKLEVIGDVFVSGVVTASNFYGNLSGTATTATNVIGGIGSIRELNVSGITTLGITSTIQLTTQNLNVTGVSTLGFVTATNAFYTGVVTATKFYGDVDGSIDSATYATKSGVSTNVIGGIASVTSLSVSGITTLGITSATQLTAQNLNVSGVSTLGFVTAKDAFYTGVITATRFYGNLSGTATTATNVIGGIASVTSLSVSGLSTFGNNILPSTTGLNLGSPTQQWDNLYVNNITGTLTGAAASISVSPDTTDVTRYIPFVDVISGLTTVRINSSLSYNPSTGNLGIGTTNPGEKLQVDGNIRVGISTTSNYIAFRGTYNDDQTPYTHTYIGERIYDDGERSELLLFKGNDSFDGISSYAGPDRIRLAAGEFRFDIVNWPVPGTFEQVAISTNITNKMILTGDGNLGIGTTNPTSKLQVQGDSLVTGISTLGSVNIYSNGTSGIVTSSRPGVSTVFYYGDGSGLINIPSTAFTGEIGLGTNTYGDYVKNITGTTNEIEVSVTSGEGVSPQIGLPNDVTIGQDLTITRDLQINRNLNVTGNITVGGTTAYLIVNNLQVKDKDIILGITTDVNGNESSTDLTANHGGIAIASTEGTPLVSLLGIGNSLPDTYKQIMWLKKNPSTGLGTDAWVFNYGVGIGSTQIANGVRFAVGNGITMSDDSITAGYFYGDGSNLKNIPASAVSGGSSVTISANNNNQAQYLTFAPGIGTTTGLNINTTGLVFNPFTNSLGIGTNTPTSKLQVAGNITPSQNLTYNLGSSDLRWNNLYVGIVTANEYYGTFKGTIDSGVALGIATYASIAGIATVSQGLTGTPNLNVGIVTANEYYGTFKGTIDSGVALGIATYATKSGVSTAVIGGIASVTSLSVSGISTLGTVQISSGIVTATTGIVTYYGDGSKLTNISASSIVGTSTIAQKLETPRIFTISGNQFTAISTSFDGTQNATIGLSLVTQSGVTSGVYGNSNTIPVLGVNSLGIVTSTSSVTITSVSGNAGTATTATNVIGGIGSITQLQVTGVSTFTNGPVLVGSGTSTGTTSQRLQVTGGAYVSDNLGIGTTNPSQTLHVQGNVRITGALYDNNNATGTSGQVLQSVGTGISWVNASSGISSVSISTNTTNQSQYLTYVPGVGSTTGFGITTSGLVFNPSTTRLGIGTTNPSTNLHVQGDALVTGISTLSSVRIFSSGNIGIITSTNPGVTTVTYYGDGSKLSGVTATAAPGGSSGQVQFNNAGSMGGASFFNYDSANNRVGIGTSVPTARLSVANPTTGNSLLLVNDNLSDGSLFRVSNSAGNLLVDVDSGGTILFPTAGNVGIGTTLSTPTTKLHVDGDVRITRELYDTNNAKGTSGQVLQSVGTGISWVNFSGGGSLSISTSTSSQAQYLTFATGVGAATSLGIDTNIGLVFIPSTERLGIGTTNPSYNLHVNGSFGATTKSFIINHPTKEGKKLQYGSLEGPELGVYVRGRTQDSIIELPEYWTGLVDEETITVNLTAIGRNSGIHNVLEISNNTVIIESTNDVIDCFYTIFGERKDVAKLEVEISEGIK